MSGKRVAVVLVLILCATVILPPAAASVVNRRRVDRARADVAALALQLEHVHDPQSRLAPGTNVLCGPGRAPAAATTEAGGWVTEPRGSLGDVIGAAPALRADPWGNCYLVNLGAAGSRTAAWWIISAGPNGVVDTPYRSANLTAPAGDDIGLRVK